MAADESREKDLEHPKVQFPTRKQCPKCYKPVMDKIDPSQLSQPNYEPPFDWDMNEIFKFLTTYYSKTQISTKVTNSSALSVISSSSSPDSIKEPLIPSTSSSKSNLNSNDINKNSNLSNNDESLKIEEMNDIDLDGNDFNYQALVNQKNEQLDNDDSSKKLIKDDNNNQEYLKVNAKPSFNFTFLFLFSITILAFYFIYSNFKHKYAYKLKKHIV